MNARFGREPLHEISDLRVIEQHADTDSIESRLSFQLLFVDQGRSTPACAGN
jgi:hypothetical protein